MEIDIGVKINGVEYIIVIKWGLFKTKVSMYEKVTETGCRTPEYEITRASTIMDWLKYIAKKPYRKIRGIYFKYFAS